MMLGRVFSCFMVVVLRLSILVVLRVVLGFVVVVFEVFVGFGVFVLIELFSIFGCFEGGVSLIMICLLLLSC